MRNARKTIWTITACFAIGALSSMHAQENETLSTAELLEEGVYLQEAEGNLDRAIEVYRSIIDQDESSRAFAAEAQFRLAICLLKQGERLQATEAFEALVAKFPDQTQWSDAALEYLPAAFAPLPAPWAEGERMKFKWLMNGSEVGESFVTMTTFDWEGRELWLIDHQVHVGGRRHVRIEFDKETARPAYSHWNLGSPIGTINSWYGEDEIRVEGDGNDEPKIYPESEIVYDNEQVLILFRQMPLEIGHSEQIKIFVPLSGQTVSVNAKVSGIEEVDTGMGKLECYRVDVPMARNTFWYTMDEHRYLAKLQVGEITARLTEVSIVDPSKTKPVSNEDIGFSYEIPQNWETRVSSTSEEGKQARLYVLDPDFEADFRVVGRNANDEVDTSEAGLIEFAEQSLKGLKDDIENFVLDENSLRVKDAGNRKAAVFSGTYVEREKTRRFQFTGFLEAGKKLHLTINHPDGERNEEFSRVYDIVLNSLEID